MTGPRLFVEYPARPDPDCPKRMVFGPCGGIRDDRSCEIDARPCPFGHNTQPVQWQGGQPGRNSAGELLRAAEAGPVILTDLSVAAFDRGNLEEVAKIVGASSDSVLVGEHQNRPDFPPTVMAQMIAGVGGRPWITLTCRDRNRVVLEQELMGLRQAGADGVFCVTGDGRAQGVRPDVTQVFDLDGTRLTALAAQAGLSVGVPEAPQAEPTAIRPGRLLQKQRAGAGLAVLNHVGTVAALREFVSTARAAGVTIPIIAGVAVYTDERSARVLAAFPGLHLDPTEIARVVTSDDPRSMGIETAVQEAADLLSVPGVAGVNLSGLASGSGEIPAAHVKAEVAERIRERMSAR
ncbi:methylenetetrahydrofolate reductase [Williamsia sp. 1135]|uniref:methylenetetrahydrofolate reductase n=1 Tax=Williamsia sp. 1135 TaxID=1889262 RepID=UPI000A11278F|nr:methylenetetrahydrofolate reductase [Williamsia sp. 1135]ORM34742.1 methylenetetrahydrofolate reductase [Williamsia sp. 1135]